MSSRNKTEPISPSKSERSYTALIEHLIHLQQDMQQLSESFAETISHLHPSQQLSATNLVHYVSLRRHDLRELQTQLPPLGLSSLGRAERFVMANLEAVLQVLCMMAQVEPPSSVAIAAVDYEQGDALLEKHTRNLLGESPQGRDVHVMVTMPSEAADEPQLIHNLLAAGMNVMRVNCAHDDEAAWASMIEHLRSAEKKLGLSCRILMDLGGPKLRTGELPTGPQVLKWRPQRDNMGRVTAPARVWLFSEDNPSTPASPASAELPVAGDWLSQLQVGDRVHVQDTRGRSRSLKLVEQTLHGFWGESDRTTYVVSGARLWLDRKSRGTIHSTLLGDGHVGSLMADEQPLLLNLGDLLHLTADNQPGQPAQCDNQGQVTLPARIACSLPEVFSDVQPGHRILFDDGKIGGVIRQVLPHQVTVEITQARAKGEKLKAHKGINLPDSTLHLSALTPEDLGHLEFVVKHADLVGYSFVNTPEDVRKLQAELQRLGGEHLGLVLKIETRRAFDNLPSLLLAAMRSPSSGVMIARGDLAVECGYQRLAEIQEEILWLCEAAHMPVIWATQVLETLASTGIPSRAEVTDAAMSERAECVMLNKGPFIINALQFLNDVLPRMEGHQRKKSSMLRKLNLADQFKKNNP